MVFLFNINCISFKTFQDDTKTPTKRATLVVLFAVKKPQAHSMNSTKIVMVDLEEEHWKYCATYQLSKVNKKTYPPYNTMQDACICFRASRSIRCPINCWLLRGKLMKVTREMFPTQL